MPIPLSKTAQFPDPKVQLVDGKASGPEVDSNPSVNCEKVLIENNNKTNRDKLIFFIMVGLKSRI